MLKTFAISLTKISEKGTKMFLEKRLLVLGLNTHTHTKQTAKKH